MPLYLWYKQAGLSSAQQTKARAKIEAVLPDCCLLREFQTESCFYIQSNHELMDTASVEWMLGSPFKTTISKTSGFESEEGNNVVYEIGPRLNFSTAFSTNAVSMFHSIGLKQVTRVEASTRYRLKLTSKDSEEPFKISNDLERQLVGCLHDKMTECRYVKPLTSFDLEVTPAEVYDVDIIGGGRSALEIANKDLGLAFDSWDLDYYTKLFRDKIKRNPTSVECFDLAQSNSEHSRHWFFRGRMVVDGHEEEQSLLHMVMSTQERSNPNNTIKFSDNSSAIEGFNVKSLCPLKPSEASAFRLKDEQKNIIFTAETHNFPTGVAPFPGATTGTGGRIRDVQATGRGAHVIAGTAGYCFGNLNIPGYDLPWEDGTYEYPPNFAPPLQVAIEASDGASDYGNKFGEPVLTGFARSFGLKLANGERREWVKPIMFSGGIGSMNDSNTAKLPPEIGMEIVKVGGPVYRIGVGGGAASSVQVQGDNEADLDFGAVQRGDAEMEQKMNRVIRACVELDGDNPICSIHDQGAGGNGNVLKEISEPAGALVRTGAFTVADPTLSALELWGAEYQESNALLVRPEHRATLLKMARREKCGIDFVGAITGDGKIRLLDDREKSQCISEEPPPKQRKTEQQYPVELDLELVLGSMPRKVFELERVTSELPALCLPDGLTVSDAVKRVLRLPSVASKRYLTNKVDRAVSGLVAQQQCVGPLHTPLADVAVVALSHFGTVGGATAIGEQPIKGLVDAACGARMTVGEALTNLVFAQITDLKDVKCSGNWMWAAKLRGEGALLVDACKAMCDVMGRLGVAVDGGKDSLSMAARVGSDTVKAPGTLVVSAYAGCPDITATVTPDLKCPDGSGALLWVRFSPAGLCRLGGSALAQCYGQLGNTSPDMDDPDLFARAFEITQQLIKERKLCSGHDVSDGGLITCLLEMSFAGNCGLDLDIPTSEQCVDPVEMLFGEELGIVIEVEEKRKNEVLQCYTDKNVPCVIIGTSTKETDAVNLSIDGSEVLQQPMTELRDMWEATGFQLEKLQANPLCVEQEEAGLKHRKTPPFQESVACKERIEMFASISRPIDSPYRVAVIREEGSNGDREMAAAFFMAGFQVWDVNTQDLTTGAVTLDQFSGLVFVGGFSYADVLGSAKGWAGAFMFNDILKSQLMSFYEREDTFSLGVCNGCQLMATLGLVGSDGTQKEDFVSDVHLGHNASGRFESRFVSVKIEKSPAVMLKGLEGSTLGIWLQHGEGQFKFRDEATLKRISHNLQAPIRYVDDDNAPTETYPFNPNGSVHGIAALCSKDGRHLAMMPHPERCVLPWQWPWLPWQWRGEMRMSPWLCLFHNAYQWCEEVRNGA